jgi:hypothetical protein
MLEKDGNAANGAQADLTIKLYIPPFFFLLFTIIIDSLGPIIRHGTLHKM